MHSLKGQSFPSLPGNEANLLRIDAAANISRLSPNYPALLQDLRLKFLFSDRYHLGFDLDELWKLRSMLRVEKGAMWHFQCFLVGGPVTDEVGCGVGGPWTHHPHNSVAASQKSTADGHQMLHCHKSKWRSGL